MKKILIKLDKKIKSSILIKYLISLDFKKYFSQNIFKNLVKKSRSLSSGVMSPKTLRSKLMKAKKDIFEHTMWLWLSAALLIALLTACGGGGGGGVGPTFSGGGVAPVDPGTTTIIITPTTFSFTCWNGAITSTVAQPTKIDCAAVPTTNINVSLVGGALTVTGLPAGVVITSSTFTAISGASTLVYTNGALTGGTPLSAATYTFTGASVAFTNAPPITLAGTFVSPVIVTSCVAPTRLNTLTNTCVTAPAATGYTWNSVVGGGVWVADIGVLVTGANLLPATSLVIGDAAWLTAAANGTIKYVKTASTKPQDSRPLIYAFYKTTNAPGNTNGTEYYAVIPMYADVIATNAGANQNVGNGSQANIITEVKGSAGGAKQNIPTFGTFERIYDGANFVNIQLGPIGSSI